MSQPQDQPQAQFDHQFAFVAKACLTVADLCAAFQVPHFPVEPGHVMSKAAYQRMLREQQQ